MEYCEESKDSVNIKTHNRIKTDEEEWKHTKMNEGGRGERKQYTFSSAFTLEFSIIILEVKPSTPVCISLNRLHQEITADLWITTAAGAAGEKGFSSRQGPFVFCANLPHEDL